MTLCSPSGIRPAGPAVERIRYEMKTRQVEVAGVRRLTPGMIRIVLRGDDLVDFSSLGFDDHVKLFAPTPAGAIARRDYTPRHYDRVSRTPHPRLRRPRRRSGDVMGASGATRRPASNRRTQGVDGGLATGPALDSGRRRNGPARHRAQYRKRRRRRLRHKHRRRRRSTGRTDH